MFYLFMSIETFVKRYAEYRKDQELSCHEEAALDRCCARYIKGLKDIAKTRQLEPEHQKNKADRRKGRKASAYDQLRSDLQDDFGLFIFNLSELSVITAINK